MASKGVRDLEIENWKGKEDTELRAESRVIWEHRRAYIKGKDRRTLILYTKLRTKMRGGSGLLWVLVRHHIMNEGTWNECPFKGGDDDIAGPKI